MINSVVITGEGIVSAIGIGKDEVLHSLLENKTGIGIMNHLDSIHTELPVGEVKLSNEEMKLRLNLDSSEEISRTALMGILSVKQALEDANLFKKAGLRVLFVSGTTVGGMDVTEKHYSTFKESEDYLKCLDDHDCGSSTRIIADYFNLFDDYTTISTACSSAANSIILGTRLIEADIADVVVAGGSEALTRFHLNGFNSLMILDKEVCRPFDENRAGLNLGEGAAYVVLEREDVAIGRNATVHAYVTGYGNACDAYHQTASSENGEGAFLAMTKALTNACINPSDIQYVNAHGTGTINNDRSESTALKRVFGDGMPYVSSTKSFTGHTTSASGSIEAIICILTLQHQFVPGNLGWNNPMDDGIIPSLGIDHAEIDNVLCNSFGFGGNDSSIILSRKKPQKQQHKLSVCKHIRVLSKVEINDVDSLKEITGFISPIEVRRMGKLMRASLLSSFKALQQAGITMPDAIITATSLGCMENSELLLEQMKEEGEVLLKPTLFMQSTHNTLSSNIAIQTHCHGYNVTYSQGEKSLEWALLDAKMLLGKGYKYVLVGFHDEATPFYQSLMKKMGKEACSPLHSISMVVTCGE